MFLIDGHGLAFRGFYALPATLAASDGTPTNAIVGFMNMLLKGMDKWGRDGIGLFFDPKGPTRRHEIFKAYKEGRRPTPEEFKIQLPLIIELSRAMGIPVFIRDGVEADDYIVSTACSAAEDGWKVNILSADKDLLQVVSGDISVIRPTKGVSDFRLYDEGYFTAEFGFAPARMADYLSLIGDTVDNIPGVPGIGDKTARELIVSYGALEGIYEHIGEIAKGRRSKLEENRDLVFLSRGLIIPQITEAVPLEQLSAAGPDMESLRPLCTRLGLKKLLQRFETSAEGGNTLKSSQKAPAVNGGDKENNSDLYVSAVPAPCKSDLSEILLLKELAIAAGEENNFFLAARDGRFACLRLCDADETAAFAEWSESGTLTLYGYREMLVKNQLHLPPFHHIKDVEIAHYLLHPDRGGTGIEKTIGRQLRHGAELASDLFGMYDTFERQLKEYSLDKLMYELDLPLCPVLAKLQNNGIPIDRNRLAVLASDLETEITGIETDLADMIGERINLNSPKQVSWLLFEKLRLPPFKKNKSGYSTDISVLEELARLPEPLCDIPSKLIEYRELTKILSGFVQPFLNLSSHGDGRIHSTFDHLSTGTGRLASRDPNVQNMPVFGRWAVRFRDCFVPSAPDKIFVAADYSQIELRVLAHLSGEERLIEAFKEGRDIHMETASWVFGLPPEDITPEQRRFAKVVNFGLLYGMSAHGLGRRLGIPRPQAASMVERYFSVLPKVKEYLDKSMKDARAAGFTRSIFGRIRPLAEVSTVEGRGNDPIGRVAVNTPIQSAASDIAKIALMRFDKVLSDEFTGAFPVLQIHDSIVCECWAKDADAVEKRLVAVMESVDVLSVPVKAEPKHGDSLSKV